jgi:ribose transport system substrate-binding protein
MGPNSGSVRRRVRLSIAGAVSGLLVVLSVTGVLASSSQAVASVAHAAAASCGTVPSIPPPNSASVLATLPKSAQGRYNLYPYQVKKSLWAAFAGKKPPWKIGFISFPVTSPWQVGLDAELKAEIAQAKKAGLVSSLVTYIQPDPSTATPEQQIGAIQQMVREGVNGIMVLPDAGPPLVPAIDAAGKAGVPVVLIANAVDKSKYAISVYSQNQAPAQAGVLGLIKKGNVLIVHGIPGVPAEAGFDAGVKAVLSLCPQIHVAGQVTGQWSDGPAKAAVLQYLASHPAPLDAVLQNGSMGEGIIGAFQQTGHKVPPISLGGCEGGDLSWWLAHKSTYQTVGTCDNGPQTMYTTFRVLIRVLGGDGLKVNAISLPPELVTNQNIASFAPPNKPLDWTGSSLGPLSSWASDSVLNDYFSKPGSPGGF